MEYNHCLKYIKIIDQNINTFFFDGSWNILFLNVIDLNLLHFQQGN